MTEKTLKALESAIRLSKLTFDPAALTPTQVIACDGLVDDWMPGVYAVGDVRVCGGQVYRCCQAHDSTDNPDWSPDKTPALWAAYHSGDAAHARPWVQPTGAHDQYKAGEYMVWTDGKTYKCLSDTVYSPADYAQAWELVTG